MKGIYALLIQIDEFASINVGALGKKDFKPGLYAYVGSAQNGVEQRVKRHLENKKTLFWHIDYLLNSKKAKIIKILYKQAHKEEECRLAQKLRRHNQAAYGFGSSDCHCLSHLFSISNSKELDTMKLLSTLSSQ